MELFKPDKRKVATKRLDSRILATYQEASTKDWDKQVPTTASARLMMSTRRKLYGQIVYDKSLDAPKIKRIESLINDLNKRIATRCAIEK
jgi:hypothetical protein